MKLTCDRPPYDELVAWACHAIQHLHKPADRPWYFAAPPPRPSPYWEYLCACRRQPVRVMRYDCTDAVGSVYLGQCSRCEAIIWTFAGAPGRR